LATNSKILILLHRCSGTLHCRIDPLTPRTITESIFRRFSPPSSIIVPRVAAVVAHSWNTLVGIHRFIQTENSLWSLNMGIISLMSRRGSPGFIPSRTSFPVNKVIHRTINTIKRPMHRCRWTVVTIHHSYGFDSIPTGHDAILHTTTGARSSHGALAPNDPQHRC
jgi:hypothetical protein